jgi:hypothetical protein
MQFSPLSCQFIPFGTKYSTQHPVLKHSQSVIFPLMWETKFHNHTKQKVKSYLKKNTSAGKS